VVKVTTIREGHEYKDLDYPDEGEGIQKLVDAKGYFILWPRKDIIVKTHSSLIVLQWSIEVWDTRTSNMSKPAQNSHTSATPPPAQDCQDLELQESMGRRPPSPPPRDKDLQDSTELRPISPPAQVPELQDTMEKRLASPCAKDKGLHDTMGKRPPSPPAQDLHSHPSIEQPELLPSIDRETTHPLPSTQ
jgi:hypothetical protein